MSHGCKQYSLPVLVVLLTVFAAAVVVFIEPPSANGQRATGPPWNPRKVPAGTVFLSDQACTECHKKFGSFATTGMAQAMEPVASSKVLSENPKLTMQVGPYTYEILRDGKQSTYSVTDGKQTISLPIRYAFGQGRMGQTYLLERDGKFYESLVSFYNEPKSLDFTTGAARTGRRCCGPARSRTSPTWPA